MKYTNTSYFLLAHSHGVALLDGVTDWRKGAKATPRTADVRYGKAFQGWYDGAIGDDIIRAKIIDASSPIKELHAWVISSHAGIGVLAQLDESNGETVLRINERLTQFLSMLSDASSIVSMLNGSDYTPMMLNLWSPYDFIEPGLPLVSGVPVIDEVFVNQTVDDWTKEVYASLVAIKRLVRNRLIHILPPPPREKPQQSQHLETFGALIVKHGFQSDQLRLKWYRRYCSRLTAALRAIDCEVLAPPGEALTVDGLLKEEYAEGLTHGNREYGILLSSQIGHLLGAIHESI